MNKKIVGELLQAASGEMQSIHIWLDRMRKGETPSPAELRYLAEHRANAELAAERRKNYAPDPDGDCPCPICTIRTGASIALDRHRTHGSSLECHACGYVYVDDFQQV